MLTTAQAAELLGLSPATLRVQVRRGRLAVTKLGPINVVDEVEVERYRRDSLGRSGRPEGAKDSHPRTRGK